MEAGIPSSYSKECYYLEKMIVLHQKMQLLYKNIQMRTY